MQTAGQLHQDTSIYNQSTKNIDWATSKIIADVVNAKIGECLANAVRAFLDHRDILPQGAILVEGIYAYGGQYSPHTWIETSNTIIELSLVRDTNKALRESVQYFPIQPRSESEIMKLYGDKPRNPGVCLIMELGFDDERVINLLNEVDTPPGLKF